MLEVKASVKTFTADIYLAGDYAAAIQACQSFTNDVGLCVTVTHCHYVYTGGAESGVKVGLINYPRFPSTPHKITMVAQDLANHLITELGQQSASVVTSDNTFWFSRRPEDQLPKGTK